MDELTIGRVAQLSEVSIETVRYYEKRGLISKASRTQAGYRVFEHETVEDIRFIRSAQTLGLTLEEINQIISIYNSGDDLAISTMYAFAANKIVEIEEKINQLQHQKSLLKKIVLKSDAAYPLLKEQCPVIQLISTGGNKYGEN